MKQPLHIIHVEDCQADFELVQLMLRRAGLECEIQRVETRNQLENALHESECDLILSDCTLPQFHGLEALQIAHARKPEIPFIFISGTIGEEMAVSSLQNGATDYILKQRLARLVPAVRRALTEAQERKTRRAMETQLRQARKLETIGTFTGGLAHDFRNLLQILKTGIEMLPLKAHDPEQVIKITGRLNKAAEQGCTMVEELMTFARKTEGNLRQVDMARLIEEITHMLRAILPANVNLSLNLERNPPTTLADASQMDRILTNLIMNARDAMPQGGEIVVSTDIVKFDCVSENSWQIQDAPYLRVQISDNGTGMDEATQSRIFEPFFTTKPVGRGTGLGLSVVFGLMEAHHGFIDLQSKVGEGTTFSLFFPLPPGAKVALEKIQVVSPVRLLGEIAQESQA